MIIGLKLVKKNRTLLWVILVRYFLYKVRNGIKVILGIFWGKRYLDIVIGFIFIFKEFLILG